MGYVEYVAIMIDFSKDIIDVSKYDELNEQSDILSAKDLINSLKLETSQKNGLRI